MVAFTAFVGLSMNNNGLAALVNDGDDLNVKNVSSTQMTLEVSGVLSYRFGGDIHANAILNTINDSTVVNVLVEVSGGVDRYVITGFSKTHQQISDLSSMAAILSGNDTINGSGQNDTLLRGFKGNDKIKGNAGNDTLKGESGDDTLKGGGGKDILFGGKGADKMTGGGGKDIFVFDAAANKHDMITDFNTTSDLIYLSRDVFAGIGAAGDPLAASKFHVIGDGAIKASHRILYDPDDHGVGVLYYDSNGSGAGGRDKICELDDGLHLKASDFLVIA
jgi:Ca2+-binding RTX toxin-like protein